MSSAAVSDLKSLTVKELQELARKWEVAGGREMRKEELIYAVTAKIKNAQRRELAAKKRQESKNADSPRGRATSVSTTKEETKSAPKTAPPSPAELRRLQEERTLQNDISVSLYGKPASQQDRVSLIVRDQFWLQANWEIMARSVERARVAMGPHWHGAVPVLRLFRYVSEGNSSPRREIERNVRVHGGVSKWYIDVKSPPARFQVELGYLSRSFDGNFFMITSSNVVETPQMPVIDQLDSLDGNWTSSAKNYDYTRMTGASTKLAKNVMPISQTKLATKTSLPLQLDLELVVSGKTTPTTQLRLQGETVKLGKEGGFSVKFPFPEEPRTVLSIDAYSADGNAAQKIIISAKRDTRIS